ncbi:MAG: hypothetical protein RPR98_07335 [Bermanella sp.]
MCLISAGQLTAAPSPLADEDFLLFLADSLQEEEGIVDPLTMVAGSVPSGSPFEATQQDKLEPEEDKNEH